MAGWLVLAGIVVVGLVTGVVAFWRPGRQGLGGGGASAGSHLVGLRSDGRHDSDFGSDGGADAGGADGSGG